VSCWHRCWLGCAARKQPRRGSRRRPTTFRLRKVRACVAWRRLATHTELPRRGQAVQLASASACACCGVAVSVPAQACLCLGAAARSEAGPARGGQRHVHPHAVPSRCASKGGAHTCCMQQHCRTAPTARVTAGVSQWRVVPVAPRAAAAGAAAAAAAAGAVAAAAAPRGGGADATTAAEGAGRQARVRGGPTDAAHGPGEGLVGVRVSLAEPYHMRPGLASATWRECTPTPTAHSRWVARACGTHTRAGASKHTPRPCPLSRHMCAAPLCTRTVPGGRRSGVCPVPSGLTSGGPLTGTRVDGVLAFGTF
jgi:hypothetical protein